MTPLFHRLATHLGHQGGRELTVEKIADVKPSCVHPEHNPPTHQVFEPGVYRHTCPACGRVQVFTVQRVMA